MIEFIVIGVSLVTAHYVIKVLAFEKVTDYLNQAHLLLLEEHYTDGCSTPFKTYIHRWMSKSHDLCAAHDYGSLGYITVAKPGWHNNWVTWLAHLSQSNPVYWVWGTIVATVTLPWVVWRRNLGITFAGLVDFHVVLIAGTIFAVFILLVKKGVI